MNALNLVEFKTLPSPKSKPHLTIILQATAQFDNNNDIDNNQHFRVGGLSHQ